MKTYIKSQNMLKIFLKTENQIYQLSMEIPTPSPPITSLSTNIGHIHNVFFFIIFMSSNLMSYLFPPAQCFVAPPQKEDCSTVRCRPGSLSILYSSTSDLYSIAILVTRNKSKIFFMGRYTNCHP